MHAGHTSPATIMMDSAPPGCSSRNLVPSMTLPLCTNQALSLESCWATCAVCDVSSFYQGAG